MKVVLDCNVLISAGITNGVCRKILFESIKNHQIFVSQEIINEYSDVIMRRTFESFQKELQWILRVLLNASVTIKPKPCPFQLPDPDDEPYLATALSAKADVLITGNKKHFPLSKYENVSILNPHEFLKSARHP